jgi:hypothetical protein
VGSRPPTDRCTSARRGRRVAAAALQIAVRTTAKSRILDRLTASPEQAIQRRRVGTSQIRREPTRTMQPGRSRDYGLYRRVGGTHIGQPSTNIDLERQTSWTTHELTSRRARNPAPRHARLEGRSASTPHMSPRARSVVPCGAIPSAVARRWIDTGQSNARRSGGVLAQRCFGRTGDDTALR